MSVFLCHIHTYSWVSNKRPTPLINFSVFFHPGHSSSNTLTPAPSTSVNYWGMFPTQKNFFKQYTYADFFEVLINERSICIMFSFVGLCKEANTLKKPTYCQLLTSFRKSNQMFVDLIHWICFLIFFLIYFIGWTLCVLLIVWILYCWSFVPLVSFCFYLILASNRMHLIQKCGVFKKSEQPKTLQLHRIRF